VTGAERLTSDANDVDITGAMFVCNNGLNVFLCCFQQGVVLAIDRGGLMGDPIGPHLLVKPEQPDSISRATSVIGSRYAYYFNKTYKRTGTVWEGRHKSSLVQSDRYFLTCCRYIELNPVAANMVAKPEEYKWSSYLVNAWGRKSNLTPHEEYLGLGSDIKACCYAYRELFKYQISEQDIHLIEHASKYCQPVGDERFREQIESKYSIKLGQPGRGRFSKAAKSG